MSVSIVIPVYNGDKFISKCLQSVIEQSYSDLEIIIVDDGSSDNTKSIIQEYSVTDNRIKYFYQKNQGASVARNNGVEKAHGKYLLFVDADDYLAVDMVEKIVAVAEDSKSEIVCFAHFKVVGRNKIPYLFNWDCSHAYDAIFGIQKILQFHIKGYIWDKLFKLDYWKKLKLRFEKNRYCEDWIPISQYIGNSKTISFVNEPLYYYVQHEASAIHTSNLKVIKDYDYAVSWILKLPCIEKQDKSDICYFKVMSCLEIFHELYNVAKVNKVSVYKLARENNLPSLLLDYREIFLSSGITMSMKIKMVLWYLHLYNIIKR